MITAKYLALENDNVPHVKLLCGGDFLESFAVPGLWKEDDVSSNKFGSIFECCSIDRFRIFTKQRTVI